MWACDRFVSLGRARVAEGDETRRREAGWMEGGGEFNDEPGSARGKVTVKVKEH